MTEQNLKLKLNSGKYGVCRLNSQETIPEWCLGSEFFSITKTEDELSIVCDEANIKDDVLCEKGWRMLKVVGPLDFSLVGILFSISKVLAESNVSIFAVSTYNTDYVLVKDNDLDNAVSALTKANYEIVK